MKQNPQKRSILKKHNWYDWFLSVWKEEKKRVTFNDEVQVRTIEIIDNSETPASETLETEYGELPTDVKVVLPTVIDAIDVALITENFVGFLEDLYDIHEEDFTKNAKKLKNAIKALNLKPNDDGVIELTEESLKVSSWENVKAFLYSFIEFCASLVGLKDKLPPSIRELKTNASKEIKSFEEYLEKRKSASVEIVQ